MKLLVDDVNINKIEGAIVECGVYKGGAIMWMIEIQKKYHDNRKIYLYDTFDGMTEPQTNTEREMNRPGKEYTAFNKKN